MYRAPVTAARSNYFNIKLTSLFKNRLYQDKLLILFTKINFSKKSQFLNN